MPDSALLDETTLIINGQEISVPSCYTLMQACEAAGVEIPRFCYHERLSIAGNCRMCLVEWEGAPKPIASCAQNVGEMQLNPDGSPPRISTDSARTIKARRGVMEFLLINHPLDCPVCDQGGECDLQDQAMLYGRGVSRYHEDKRAVEDKYMGPLVKTVMTRCIQCTRCVRFAAEVAGVEEIGLVGRGENAQITSWLEQSLTSELSGNVIDICPVGALTSRPYAFSARPWELESTDSIDVMDGLGSHIRIDSRTGSVMRILPRLCDEINGEWISDKTRFVWDGLSRQRLDSPYVRKDGHLVATDWDTALERVATRLLQGDPESIAALAGDLACTESLKSLLDLLRSLGVMSTDCRQDGTLVGDRSDGRQSWIFNAGIAGMDSADALLIIGSNPRLEAPVLNARIRQGWLHNGLQIGLIGESSDLTYAYEHIGTNPQSLQKFSDHAFSKTLEEAKRPIILLGQGALARADGEAVLHLASDLAARLSCESGWQPFNMLHTAAARVGGLDLGFLPGTGGRATGEILEGASNGEVQTLFLAGADEIDMGKLGRAFVIYMGSHGDSGANRADVILPATAYTEKEAGYVNTEGRLQWTRAAVPAKGQARADWMILRALSERMGKTLPYDDLSSLRDAMAADDSLFGRAEYFSDPVRKSFGRPGSVSEEVFASSIGQFYLSNPIARASKVMGECAAMAKEIARRKGVQPCSN